MIIYQIFYVFIMLVYFAFGMFSSYSAFKEKSTVTRDTPFPQRFLYYHGIAFMVGFVFLALISFAFSGIYSLLTMGGK